jgi:hypothetical protein
LDRLTAHLATGFQDALTIPAALKNEINIFHTKRDVNKLTLHPTYDTREQIE